MALIDKLKVGDVVLLRNGGRATITAVSQDLEDKYPIRGILADTSGEIWARNGGEYFDGTVGELDIMELAAARWGLVETTTAFKPGKYGSASIINRSGAPVLDINPIDLNSTTARGRLEELQSVIAEILSALPNTKEN